MEYRALDEQPHPDHHANHHTDHDSAEAHTEDDYRGEAVVFDEHTEVAVLVTLRGNIQPIDGMFHWYGRAAANDELNKLAGGRKTEVVLRTPHGDAKATLSEPDPWNRYRITGVGRPPFPLDHEMVELDT